LTLSSEIIELSNMEEFRTREYLTSHVLEVIAIAKKPQREGPFSRFFDLEDIAAVFGQGSHVFVIGSVLVEWGSRKCVLSFRFKENYLKGFKSLNIKPYKQLSKKVAGICGSEKKHKDFQWKLSNSKDLNGVIDAYETALPWLDFHVASIDNASLSRHGA